MNIIKRSVCALLESFFFFECLLNIRAKRQKGRYLPSFLSRIWARGGNLRRGIMHLQDSELGRNLVSRTYQTGSEKIKTEIQGSDRG